MPRRYQLQSIAALFALAVLGCEQSVTDPTTPASKDLASPAVTSFDGGAKTIAPPVVVTAVGTFTRTWTWGITKSVDPSTATLVPGATTPLTYEVGLDASAADSDWMASGSIYITAAPPPAPPSLVDVAVDVGGIPAVVSCPDGLPVGVLPGLTVECTYAVALPDGAPRATTVVLIDLFGMPPFPLFTPPVDVVFAGVEIDECVDVDDSLAGVLGTVCAADGLTHLFSYDLPAGPYTDLECGDHVIDNTASFLGTDGQTGSATASSTVTVECTAGPTEVDVDIKPGGDKNPINIGGKGKGAKGKGGNANIPVAILTTDDFDAAEVDLATVTLGESMTVGITVKKNGTLQASLDDVDDDGDLDLVMHFRIGDLVTSGDLDASTIELCVNGSTVGGDGITGCDNVTIVGG